MISQGWSGAENWATRANKIVPTLVDGSKKRGGLNVGPSRIKEARAKLGVKGPPIAGYPPAADDPVDQPPRLTVATGALTQGFSSE